MLVYPFALLSQGGHAAKSSSSDEGISSLDAVASQLIKLGINGETRDFDYFFKCGQGKNLKELDKVLGKELEQGIEADNLWTIMSSNAVFLQDPILLIKEAIQKNYNNYLKCMLIASHPWYYNKVYLKVSL